MRYEAKHSFFKKMASITGNYINLPYTLAKRHQQQQCYNMLSPSNFLKLEVQYGKGMNKCVYMLVVLFILSYSYTIATLVDIEEVPLRGELERLCVGLTPKTKLSK